MAALEGGPARVVDTLLEPGGRYGHTECLIRATDAGLICCAILRVLGG